MSSNNSSEVNVNLAQVQQGQDVIAQPYSANESASSIEESNSAAPHLEHGVTCIAHGGISKNIYTCVEHVDSGGEYLGISPLSDNPTPDGGGPIPGSSSCDDDSDSNKSILNAKRSSKAKFFMGGGDYKPPLRRSLPVAGGKTGGPGGTLSASAIAAAVNAATPGV